jgi:hypothetical protein
MLNDRGATRAEQIGTSVLSRPATYSHKNTVVSRATTITLPHLPGNPSTPRANGAVVNYPGRIRPCSPVVPPVAVLGAGNRNNLDPNLGKLEYLSGEFSLGAAGVGHAVEVVESGFNYFGYPQRQLAGVGWGDVLIISDPERTLLICQDAA